MAQTGKSKSSSKKKNNTPTGNPAKAGKTKNPAQVKKSSKSGSKSAGRSDSGAKASGRSAAKPPGTAYAGRNKAPSKIPAPYSQSYAPPVMPTIGFYLLSFFYLLLFLSNFGVAGKFGEFFSGFMFGVFGQVAYIFPVILFTGSLFHMMGKGESDKKSKFWAMFFFVMTLCMLVSLLAHKAQGSMSPIEHFTASQTNKIGGGIIGGTMIGILIPLFGVTGAYLADILLFIISLTLFTGKSPYHLFMTYMEDRREYKEEAAAYARAMNAEQEYWMDEEDNCLEDPYYKDPYQTTSHKKEPRVKDLQDGEKNTSLNTSKSKKSQRGTAASKATNPAQASARKSILNADLSVENGQADLFARASGMKIDDTPARKSGHKVIDNFEMMDIRQSRDRLEFPDAYEGRTVGSAEANNSRKNAGKSRKTTKTLPSDFVIRAEERNLYSDDMGEIHIDTYPDGLEENRETLEKQKTIFDDFSMDDISGDDPAKDNLSPDDLNPDNLPKDSRSYKQMKLNTRGGRIQETLDEEPYGDIDYDQPGFEEGPVTAKPKKARAKRKGKLSAEQMEEDTEEIRDEIDDVVQEQTEAVKQYRLPPTDLLTKGKGGVGTSERDILMIKAKLQKTLQDFGVGAHVTDHSCGPAVTRFEITLDPGVKVSRIVSLSDDIKLALAAADIRIEAPIPGKSAVGIEVPNGKSTMVSFRDLLESPAFERNQSKIAFAVGKDIGGEVTVTDIAKMPHLLIAGATGSGKSVCINTIIMSILYKAKPDEVKLIMIDPKVVELSIYNGIPHLLIPVVTDPKKAAGALNWAVQEMTDRYNKFAMSGVRDIKGYNAHIDKMTVPESDKPEKMYQIVIVVDELADLMMVASKDVEESICRLAQLARACGIHLIIATQRPSVNVITGLIKANMPSRIAFAVTSGIDSRTILDMNGAEKLLGKGDMLFSPQGSPKPQRIQGAFISDEEVQNVVSFIRAQNIEAKNNEEISKKVESLQSSGNTTVAIGSSDSDASGDPYFAEAGKIICDKEKASIGMLQRYLKVGFNRAARIMDQLEDAGVVGPEEGTKPRAVLMSPEQFENYLEEN